jgi:hypothetical protein
MTETKNREAQNATSINQFREQPNAEDHKREDGRPTPSPSDKQKDKLFWIHTARPTTWTGLVWKKV